MPLREVEIIQCWCCEEYSRLRELEDVQIKNGIVAAVRIEDEADDRYDEGSESPFVGRCPYCGVSLWMRNIG